MRQLGRHMRSEIGEAASVFETAVKAKVSVSGDEFHSFYTVARGSSDAAANILSYEFMAELDRPMTSLPPSVFSLGGGVNLGRSAVVLISQSGASDDLVRTASGAKSRGARILSLTNVPGSDVEQVSDLTVPIGAGPELAIPATKTVIGSIAAGMALLAGLKPEYSAACARAAAAFSEISKSPPKLNSQAVIDALVGSDSIFVIGRGAGFGAAQEVALKLKETCALHAEAYSASEVLHGPLQLVVKPLTVVILDTEEAATKESIDNAEKRFRASGARVFRFSAHDFGTGSLVPAAASAGLLWGFYHIILEVALALGLDPDVPDQLAKVTRTV